MAALCTAVPQVQADDKTDRLVRIPKPLASDARAQVLYVEFKNSPKLSVLVGQMLQAKGYRLAGTLAEADMHIMLDGAVEIKGGGRKGALAKMSELAEAGGKPPADGGPDYTHQTYHGDTIVAQALILKTVSLTSVGMWLTQKTGVAGRINEMLTGDPRGICINDCENWKRLQHLARIGVASVKIEGKPHKEGFWFVQASKYKDRIDAESSMAEALLMALEPFDAAPQMSGAPASATTEASK